MGKYGVVLCPWKRCSWTSSDGVTGVVVFDLRRRCQRHLTLGFPVERVLVDGEDRTWAAGAGTLARLEGDGRATITPPAGRPRGSLPSR